MDVNSTSNAGKPASAPGSLGGLAGHLRGLGASLCEHASLRAELAAVEFQEEKRELVSLATGMVIFCALAATTLLFAGLTAVFLAWDTAFRDHVAIAVLAVFLIATGLLGAWLSQHLRRERHPFSRTVEELRRDAAVLRRFQP
jgi:uncharacterized membrane protein YqjE